MQMDLKNDRNGQEIKEISKSEILLDEDLEAVTGGADCKDEDGESKRRINAVIR